MHHSVPINQQRLLDRFLRYVKVSTPADPHSSEYPSSECQRELGKLLLDELIAMSAVDAHQDENALVWGTVPATNGADQPTVALVAHMDTSPEAPSQNVSPQVIDAYQGGDITLPSGARITTEACHELAGLVGKTLITTDGTTLLGGDDKAGVAIIMELAETLIENPHLMHGPVRVLFTCDEEIGRGTDRIDLQKLAADVAYTVDGFGAGMIDVETFSADGATVRFIGYNIHPSIAKDRMTNAMRAAGEFLSQLPMDRSPENTSARQGFIHPHDVRGGVGEVSIELILRSFDAADLATYASEIRQLATEIAGKHGMRVEIDVRRQYRNLSEGLAKLPESVDLAVQAFKNLGRPCQKTIVRGGTDGSLLTEKGLPTPNLSSGQHNVHSVTEFACLDEMVESLEHLIEMLSLWSERRS